jgi:AAA family ATP:ADP antiporter
MFHITAVLLAVHLGLYFVVERREGKRRGQSAKAQEPLAGPGGFTLLLRNQYLLLLAALLLILNIVNTTGEYLVGRTVLETAALAPTKEANEAIVGSFYGGYYFWTSIVALVLQTFVASRLVKYIGIGGIVLALPFVGLGTYGVVASGVGLAILKWAKVAENATDYSIMNTARQLLWLPTTREEKYKAKQAADSFVVRAGDVLSAVLVWVGTTVVSLSPRTFALANVILVAVWLGLAYILLRGYQQRAADTATQAA